MGRVSSMTLPVDRHRSHVTISCLLFLRAFCALRGYPLRLNRADRTVVALATRLSAGKRLQDVHRVRNGAWSSCNVWFKMVAHVTPEQVVGGQHQGEGRDSGERSVSCRCALRAASRATKRVSPLVSIESWKTAADLGGLKCAGRPADAALGDCRKRTKICTLPVPPQCGSRMEVSIGIPALADWTQTFTNGGDAMMHAVDMVDGWK